MAHSTGLLLHPCIQPGHDPFPRGTASLRGEQDIEAYGERFAAHGGIGAIQAADGFAFGVVAPRSDMDGGDGIDAGLAEPAEVLACVPDTESDAHYAEYDGRPQQDIPDQDARHPGKDEEKSCETDENIERYPPDAEELLPQFVMIHG